MTTTIAQNIFLPTQISGCLLWLDATDRTTITGSSPVTAWRDKSGNANNATGSGTINLANNINGIQTMVFPGRSGYFRGAISITTPGVTCFAVATTTLALPNGGADQRLVSIAASGANDWDNASSAILLFNQYTTNSIQSYRGGGIVANAMVQNVPFMVSTRLDSTNGSGSMWFNGNSSGSGGMTTANFASVGYGIGTQAQTTTNETWQGNIGEVMIYNQALTTAQRQQIEGYLAWKWGLVSNLPSTHPYKYSLYYTNQPYMSTFTSALVTNRMNASFVPTQISGCTLWLDATDPNANGVPPANGATLSTWVDKSGNARNATVAAGKIAGIYSTSNKAVNFAASNTGYVTSYTAAPSLETMFVVFNNPSPSGNNNMVIGGPQGARSLSGGYAGGGAGVGAVSYLNNQITWTGMASMPASTYTSGSTVIITGQVNGLTTSISQNGGTIYSNTTASAFTAGTTTYLGTDYYSSNYYYIGYEMEVIFYNSLLSLSQRQQVEGYLAWKWGLVASLPIDHPYKNTALSFVTQPTAVAMLAKFPYNGMAYAIFNPKNISGCQLWFDAADRTTFTFNGSAVSSWRDKSANGYSVGQATGGNQPTYATNLLNGLPGIQLSLSTYLYQLGSNMPNFASASAITVFIVAKNGSSYPSGGWNIVNTMYFTGGSGATLRYHFSFGYGATNGVTLYVSNTQIGQTTAVPLNTNAIIGFTASAAGENIDVNGTITNYAGVAPISAADSTWFIFGDARGTLVADVNIYEFVGYSTTLTTAQQQQVEGYLAWKWGLVSNLPSTHAYKSFPPSP